MSADSAHGIPTTSKGTPLFNPNILHPGYMLYITGAFDDIAGGKRGTGPQIEKELAYVDQPITDYIEGQFLEHQYVVGGEFGVVNEAFGDWCQMMGYAPASTPEDRTSTHDGNANKTLTPYGFNIIVPAPGNDGDWNVDGSTLTAGEINDGLVPVPSDTTPQTGYWNWDPEADPSITPVSNPLAPDGNYNLFDADIPLVRQANRVSLLMHEKACCPSEIKGKKFLPHWKLRFYVHRKTAGTVQVVFTMKFSRKKTVNGDELL